MSKKITLDQKEVGRRLREIRNLLGLTLDKIHDITGFSKSLISEAENGLKKPSPLYLFALLDKFNINVNYILSGKGNPFLTETEEEQVLNAEDTQSLKDLVYLVKNVDIVRYATFEFIAKYKRENASMIDDILHERKQGNQLDSKGPGKSG